MKAIDSLKKGLGAAQAYAREQSTASETAQAKLSSSESSWRQQKDSLEKEVTDLNVRYASYTPYDYLLTKGMMTVAKICHSKTRFFTNTSNLSAPKQPVSDKPPMPPSSQISKVVNPLKTQMTGYLSSGLLSIICAKKRASSIFNWK
jgi:hypothetical protein